MAIELIWEPPPLDAHNGIIRQYSIDYYVLETRENVYKLLADNSTSTVVTNLHPYYTYSFKVAAVTIAAGPQSTAVTAKTLESGKSETNCARVACFTIHHFYFYPHKPPLVSHSQLKQWQLAPPVSV